MSFNSKHLYPSFYINTNMKQFDYGAERLKQINDLEHEILEIEQIEYLEDKLRSKNFIKLNPKWLRGIMNNE